MIETDRHSSRPVGLLGLVLILGGCAPTLHIETRAAPNASFQQYRTFAIGTAEEAPGGYRRRAVRPEVWSVVDAAARGALTSLGYQVAALADADLVVRVGVGVRNKPDAPAADQDAVGNQISADDPDNAFHYTDETLVIDVFDAKTMRRVWHGTSRETIKAGRVNRALVDSATQNILSRFPKAMVSSS